MIRRLSLYLRNLKRLQENGISIISSDKITQLLNVTPVQFRKDLSCFGEFGKRGVGYEVGKLIRELEAILGVDKKWEIALIGVGSLGSALLRFEGFSRFNLKIACAFDVDKKRIGKKYGEVKIYDIVYLSRIIAREKIKVAIITTPPEAAQNIADKLVSAGVKSIMNFAPLSLKVPAGIHVSAMDMACELESLIYFVQHKKNKV